MAASTGGGVDLRPRSRDDADGSAGCRWPELVNGRNQHGSKLGSGGGWVLDLLTDLYCCGWDLGWEAGGRRIQNRDAQTSTDLKRMNERQDWRKGWGRNFKKTKLVKISLPPSASNFLYVWFAPKIFLR